MESIRGIVYTLAFTTVISEIAVYIISEEKYKRILRVITALFSIFCVMSSLNLADISNIDLNAFFETNEQNDAYFSEDELNNLIEDKQIDLLKNEISTNLSDILSDKSIYPKKINIIVNNSSGEISAVICELYLYELQKELYETYRNEISDLFEFEIREYYVGDDK